MYIYRHCKINFYWQYNKILIIDDDLISNFISGKILRFDYVFKFAETCDSFIHS